MTLHRVLRIAAFFVIFAGIGSLPGTTSTAYAQSSTAGDISGTVTDSTGATIPGAKITIKSQDTGATEVLTANATGAYRASLLKPGKYSVSVTATGFQTTATEVVVQVGQVAAADLKLGVGSSATIVDVTSEAPLLHTENADISTTFSAQTVQSLPNPGNDLTFVAQTSPGAVMNTSAPSNGSASSFGNFSVFGLPATSNTFTLNGTYENDPFLNLSSSGASNLLLGNNEVSEVSVVSNAYGAQYGGLGGAQVNEITRSGTNKFHGNAVYQWNGRALNANDYFRNQTPDVSPRSFDNVNQFAASIGGPIIKDKLFFYANYEGLRIVLPTSSQVFAPTSAYINQTLANAAVNDPAAVPMYKQLFSVYQNAPGYSTAAPSTQDPNAVVYTASAGNFTHEFLLTSRVDSVLSNKDNAFGHFKWDKGTQASYTDPLNPIFNGVSIQPAFEGTLGETHVFTPNVTNQFLFSVLWYGAVFTNQNLTAANALVPYAVQFTHINGGNFAGLGGIDYLWPQGRNVTNYQFIDDVSFTRGHHNFKTGVYFRRDDVTDYSPSEFTTPRIFADETVGGSFNSGHGFDQYAQQFPTRNTQPVAVYNLAGYVQDTWKIQPNFSLTAAVRFEHNSNPICGTNCFAYTNGDFAALNTSTATAYSTLITSGQHTAFPSFQAIAVNPRVGFNFSPRGADTGTVIRGGFGLFSDVFPATVADSFLNNAPSNVGFILQTPAAGGTASPFSVNPAEATSGEQITAASNRAFQSGFANGASNDTLSASVPGFATPSIATAANKLFYPTYEEYSLELEQALDRSHHTTLAIRYVGNHGYHEPVLNNGANAGAVNNGAQGATGIINFTGFPNAPPNPNFNGVTVVGNGAGSNYNGVSVGLVRQVKTLTLQANYSYSHALDEISNGGILNFAGATSQLAPVNPYNLRQNYGNADYDVRQNFTAAYVYSLPYYGGPHLLTENWQVSGTVFHHTGFPFTIVDSAVQVGNYGAPSVTMSAQQVHGVKSCGGGAVFNNATGTTATPCAIATPGNYVDPTGFGQQERNQTYGPSYTDSDFAIQKGFRLPIPHSDTGKIAVGAQFFNLFNHPNFASPGNDIASPATFGSITSTVNTPTSILGSGLGGNASPRLIQLKGTITF
jgi:Carboxypeptidase regulatory-like domain